MSNDSRIRSDSTLRPGCAFVPHAGPARGAALACALSQSVASFASQDGAVIVGWSGIDTHPIGTPSKPFRWTEPTGPMELGRLSPQPIELTGSPICMSPDGATILVQDSEIYRW